MNILGLDRNAGASKADQYVLKQSSKKLDGMLMNHAKYWCVVYCPLLQFSVKKKNERPHQRKYFLEQHLWLVYTCSPFCIKHGDREGQ